MAELVELDVAQQAAGHGKDEGRIEQDQAGLSDVSIVEENETGGNNAGGQAVARFPHNKVDHRDSQGAQKSGHGAEGDVRNPVGDVGVANVFKVEVTIVTNKPAHESKQQLSKRRVDVEEVGPFEIVRSELGEHRECQD